MGPKNHFKKKPYIMKKILFIGTFGILLFFSASAEFGAWRKSGVKCGQGQNALGCIISSLKDNTLGQKLNCSETYFLEQVPRRIIVKPEPVSLRAMLATPSLMGKCSLWIGLPVI
jgi:hypothetical protein